MNGGKSFTRVRGARSGRRCVLASVAVLAAGLMLASTAWACTVINGTTEAYEQPNSNGPEVSTLSRGTTYYFRGNGGFPIGSNYNAYLQLMAPADDCTFAPMETRLAATTIDHGEGNGKNKDLSPGDYPPDIRLAADQAAQGNQPTVAGTILSTYPVGSAKLCFTNDQDWHSIPKSVTIV